MAPELYVDGGALPQVLILSLDCGFFIALSEGSHSIVRIQESTYSARALIRHLTQARDTEKMRESIGSVGSMQNVPANSVLVSLAYLCIPLINTHNDAKVPITVLVRSCTSGRNRSGSKNRAGSSSLQGLVHRQWAS